MTSPPWEPPRPPSGPPPGWPAPNPHGPNGGPQQPPPWPGPSWPPAAAPPPYGPPAPNPYGGYGTPPPHPYGGYGPPPPRQRKSAKGWLIGVSIAALILLGAGVVSAMGLGSRDETSYQAGRSAADGGPTMVKFGGATPEDYCKQRFTFANPLGQKSEYRRGDYMDGCLDALKEKLDG